MIDFIIIVLLIGGIAFASFQARRAEDKIDKHIKETEIK